MTMAAGPPPTNYAGGGCALTTNGFVPSHFYPRWRWEFEPGIEWAKPAQCASDPIPRWYADVDGDGIADELDSTGTDVSNDLQVGHVNYSRMPRGGGGYTEWAIPAGAPPN